MLHTGMQLRSMLIVVLIGLVGVATLQAQAAPTDQLVIGTKQAAPFAFRAPGGEWQGISIDLWRQIAAEMELEYEFRELELQELFDSLAAHNVDAIVGAITITAAREEQFDFSHPFYSTGLAIAARPAGQQDWLGVAGKLLSQGFLQVVGLLAALLLLIGALVWLLERRRNPEQFGGGMLKGVWSGFWWSAVTMTTVGYGDKAPLSFAGRILALVWMFAAIIIISSFTASITSALTVSELAARISGPSDLPGVKVVAVAGSTSEEYLKRNYIGYETVTTVAEGLREVAKGRSEAMVHDAPVLRYLTLTQFRGQLVVTSGTFERQDYGVVLPAGSPVREQINQVLLRKIRQNSWHETLRRYLGDAE